MIASLFVAAANHLLEDARWARDRLSPHATRLARLQIGELAVDFSIDGDGYLCESASAGEPEVSIRLPSPGPAGLADGFEAFAGRARINGHVEMADALGFVFRHLRWDIAGDLARLVGDVPAHRLHRGAVALLAGQKQALTALEQNLREFVADGGTPALPKAQWRARSEALACLRDAVARLDKRVGRIEAGFDQRTGSTSVG